MQESLCYHHMSWAGFADHITRVYGEGIVTAKRSYRIFVEHFVRRLVKAYNLERTYECPSTTSARQKVLALLDIIGRDSAVFPWARAHMCTDCTHPKQYRHDLAAGIDRAPENAVAELENRDNNGRNNVRSPVITKYHLRTLTLNA